MEHVLGVQSKPAHTLTHRGMLPAQHVCASEPLGLTCPERLPGMLSEAVWRTPPSQALARSLSCNRPTNSLFSAVLRIGLVQPDTRRSILGRHHGGVKAFLGFAGRRNLLPQVNQICELSQDSISLDTQNVYFLLLTVITSGNLAFACHETPARSTTNM